MRHPITSILIVTLTTAVAIQWSGAAHAQVIREVPIWVLMDYDPLPGDEQKAEMWHAPLPNQQWTPLPSHPTRPTAQFEVRELFPELNLDPEDLLTFYGVPTIRIVRGAHPFFQDVSHLPEYAKVVDLMAIEADVFLPYSNMDPCGDRQWPIVASSALTTYDLHEDHPSLVTYGMRMRGNTVLSGVSWHWNNPPPQNDSPIYLELTLKIHIGSPQNLHQVYCSWISAGDDCNLYRFCIDQGVSIKTGKGFVIAETWLATDIVMAVPVLLDHVSSIKLYKEENEDPPGTILIAEEFPSNDPGWASIHQCADWESHGWHTHPPGLNGHVPVGGVSTWYGEHTVAPGWFVYTTAHYDVPAHLNDARIDQRSTYVIWWYPRIVGK